MKPTRNERYILCGGYGPSTLSSGVKPISLNLWEPANNVTLKIKDISRKMASEVPSVFLDLLELATYVYCADQGVTRGGNTSRDFGAKWRRRLRFFIPVRNPEIWCSDAIQAALRRTLGFLSEDEYEFTFGQVKAQQSAEQYFDFGIGPGSEFYVDEVLLFSGGLDSFAGAVQEAIVDGRNIALVSHRSTPKIYSYQRLLATELGRRSSGGMKTFHVPVWIHKDPGLSRDFNQRTRSFLYACLAATVASMFKLNRIRFYENGIVSFNLPISAQVIGSRATRVTHPKTLRGFAELFGLLTEGEFQVENPFLWRTKAQVVRLVGEAECHDLIKNTVSCSSVFSRTRAHTHCGVCSQCIDRRFGTLAAGHGKDDPEEMYKVNLFTGELKPGLERTMVESYVRTAREIDAMDDESFFRRFGEINRAWPYLHGPADENAEKALDLHRRHAREVQSVLQSEFKDKVERIQKEELPESCLLILTLPDKYKITYEMPTKEDAFRKEGQFWRVCYDGKPVSLKDCVGLQYIAHLLRQPDTNIPAIDLRCVAIDAANIPLYVSTETVADKQALGEYRKALVDVEEELREAEANNDLARASVLSERKEALQEEIARSTGLRGRQRKAADDVERARQAITAAITRVMKIIEKEHPALHQHLHKSLRRGSVFAYAPSQPIHWKT